MVIPKLSEFELVDTGGNCKCLEFHCPSDHVIVITNEDLSEPVLTDDDLQINLYVDKFAVSCGEVIQTYEGRGIEGVLAILKNMVEWVNTEAMLQSKIRSHSNLVNLHIVILEYELFPPHALTGTEYEVIKIEDIDYTLFDLQETLHRKLGHADFEITAIYR